MSRSRLVTAALVAGLGLASYGFALWLTETFAPWAFYSLPSRLWELALGGLLAVGAGWLARLPAWLAVGLGLAGAALVGAGGVLIDGATPYPGTAALLPTLGAAALIAGGGRGGPVGWILTRDPVRFIGRISYSLYLWHWPILVLPQLAVGEAPPLEVRLALGALSVVVAAASWRLIEEPFRRGRVWAHRPRLVLATALTMAIAVAGVSIGLGDYSMARVDAVGSIPARGVAASAPPTAEGSGGSTPEPSTSQPAASTDAPSALPQATAAPSASAAPSPSAGPSDQTLPPPTPAPEATPVPNPWPLPADIRPALAAARSDKERIIGDGCFMSLRGSNPPDCVYGDPNGSFTIALVGDSHAAHWFPAVETIAKANGWRLLVFTKASCVFVDLPIYSPILKRQYTECEAWRPVVVQRLIEARPDLTIVSSDRWLPTEIKRDSDPTRQGEAMARLLNQIPGAIAILGDTPASRVDVPVCLSQHADDISKCATPRPRGLRAPEAGPRAGRCGRRRRHPGRPVGRDLPGRSVPGGDRQHDRAARRPSPDGDVRGVVGRDSRGSAANSPLTAGAAKRPGQWRLRCPSRRLGV